MKKLRAIWQIIFSKHYYLASCNNGKTVKFIGHVDEGLIITVFEDIIEATEQVAAVDAAYDIINQNK